MQCPRCNARINKTSKFCNSCGIKLESVKEEEQVHTSVVEQSGDYTEELIDIYIGSGKEDIKKGKFSIPAFFFGPLYYYYRKLYMEATILLILKVIIYFFLGSKFLALNFCISLYAGFTFKRHYLNHVREEAQNIINMNISGKKENALLQAYNNGGTTAAPIIVLAFLYFVAIVAIGVFMVVDEIDYEYDEYQEVEIEDLYYKVPEDFHKDTRRSNDYYEIYSTTDNYCNFYVYEKYLNGYNPNRTSPSEGIEHLAAYNEEISEELLINGYKWKHLEKTNDQSITHDLTYTGEYIEYTVSYFYVDNDAHAYCKEAYEKLKDSLEIKP